MGIPKDFYDLPDDQELTLTKKELEDCAKEKAVDAVYYFVNQCKEMAEANWCDSAVFDLGRLFGAVLNGKPYAEPPEEEK